MGLWWTQSITPALSALAAWQYICIQTYIYMLYTCVLSNLCIYIYCICTYRSHPFCWYKYSYHYLTHEFLTLSSPVVTGLWQQPREVPIFTNGQLLNPTGKKKDRKTKSYSKMLANYFPFYWGGPVTATVNQFTVSDTQGVARSFLWVYEFSSYFGHVTASYKLAYKPHIDIA